MKLRIMKLRRAKRVPVFFGPPCINYTTAHRPCMQLPLPMCNWDSSCMYANKSYVIDADPKTILTPSPSRNSKSWKLNTLLSTQSI